MEEIRTRFAPSPTGFLHIGGLRTALFSFLFARHNKGSFILRIEDTDRKRLVKGALEDIMESLRWIGINWDEGPDIGGPYGPYLQSERIEIYRTHAEKLVHKGEAYRCYCTPERLSSLRERYKKEGSFTGYDRRCRNLTEKERNVHESRGEPSVVRLKVPLQGETAFPDLIRGRITKKNEELEDLVLLKSDGFPTYHLANVVDDNLMKITHVIRGDEWISSTPIHMILYRAFGWKPPQFAHVPVILSKGGGKLSKRHGATTVREFREKGYLSEAMLNFLALLGWSLDDRTELFDMESLIKHFDIMRVNKAPAIFSYEKLDWFNAVYIRKKTPRELFELILPYISKLLSEEVALNYRDYIIEIIPLIRERIKILSDVVERIWFFFDEGFEIKERSSLIPEGMAKHDCTHMLGLIQERLERIETFTEENLENTLRQIALELGLKPAHLFMTVRVAITGTKVSPGLFETMRVLGKNRVLHRIEGAIRLLKTKE
ncbi:MAG: glutamate--tRNA ligase [Spirochaetota bacterium]